MLLPAASQSPQLIHGNMHNSVIEYPQHMSNYPLELPANHLQTLKKRKIKKPGKRRVKSIFNRTQMRFNDSSPIRLAADRRAAGVGLSVPIRIAPKDGKARDTNKLASIYKAPVVRGAKAGSLKARKIVPFSYFKNVFHSNQSGTNPNLQSMSTNDASAAVPNFQM